MVSSTNVGPVEVFLDFGDVTWRVRILLVVALFFGSVGGLVVATILKRLDNIVKEYSSASANIFTAIVCSLLFPEKFTFTVFILIAMVLLIFGIYLYETKGVRHVTVSNTVGEKNTESEGGGDSCA